MESISEEPRSLAVLWMLLEEGGKFPVEIMDIPPIVRNSLLSLFNSAFLWIHNATLDLEEEIEFEISWIIVDILLRLGFF